MATPDTDVVMIDDMQRDSPQLPLDYLSKLQEISQYRVDRRQAELWAHTRIKFLVYDDTGLRENNYDSDDDEGMVEHVAAMSLGQAALVKEKGEVSHGDQEEITRNEDTTGDEDVDGTDSSGIEPYCRSGFCLKLPAFPSHFRPRKFRLVQPPIDMESAPDDASFGLPPVCSHYVAVSYCWPVPQRDEQGHMIASHGTYQVRELDGTLRQSRALDDVLDRAVDFAISKDIRMIWIDQECLPQPTDDNPNNNDKKEQQLGVQAMDIVYNRAEFTCGLLSVGIDNQEMLDCIAFLSSFDVYDLGRKVKWNGPGPEPEYAALRHMLNRVLEFLESASADRWYRRAWVAQESLLAGTRLKLLYKVDSSLTMEMFEMVSRTAETDLSWWERSSPSDELHLPRRVQREIEIPVSSFQHLVQAAMYWDRKLGRPNLRGERILSVAYDLHRRSPLPRALAENFSVIGGNRYRGRQSIDAAGALAILSSCSCRDVQDRIVIVANMCNFEIRLDTTVLAKRCRSLRLAVVALTVLNGDYSLLVPEAYAIDHKDFPHSQSGPGWLWPLSHVPHLLDYCRPYHAGFIRRAVYNFGKPFADEGARLSAYVWSVVDTIDLSLIQTEWAKKWDGVSTVQFTLLRKDGETDDEYNHRRSNLSTKDLRDDEDHWQLIMAKAISLGRYVHEGPTRYELRTGPPDLDDPDAAKLISEIIFAILRHLFLNADSEPRGIGLANSIWHSLRTDVTRRDELLPDDVGDWLFTDPRVDDNPGVLLQLDPSREGGFCQIWFIERIMRDGFLWVGRCSEPPVAADQDDARSSTTASNSHDPSGSSKIEQVNPSAGSTDHGEPSDSILDRQFRYTYLAEVASITTFVSTLKSGNSESELKPWEDGRAMAALVEDLSGRKTKQKHGDAACARNHVAAFDVDGPCIVAIPYNGDWERLPHPELRSRSVCWVVEDRSKKPATGEGEIPKASSDPEEGMFRVLNKVRGLWKIALDSPDQRYLFT